MQRRNQKILSYVLAILMLISGMCLGNVKADSFFASSSDSKKVCLSDTINEELAYVESCTEEMLGHQSVANVVSAISNLRLKTENGESLAFLCVDILVPNTIYFYVTEDTVFSPEKHCKTVTLNYIHNQDGKK